MEWKFLWSLDGLIPQLLQLLYSTSAQEGVKKNLNVSLGDPWCKTKPTV